MQKKSVHMDLHESFRRPDEPGRSSDRSFGLLFAAVLAIVAAWPLLKGGDVRIWAAVGSAAFAVAAVGRPRVLAPLNRAWTRLGLLLGRIVNPLVMGLLFFLMVTPMGVVMRAFGKRFLAMGPDTAAKSYWIERTPPGPPPESMKNQF